MNKLVFKQSLIIPAIGGESGYVSAGVINNLQSTSPTDALSANQGRVLRLMYESLRDRAAPILDENGKVIETAFEYLLRIPMNLRFVGLTVVLSDGFRYEFKDGIQDSNFVKLEVPVVDGGGSDIKVTDSLDSTSKYDALSANMGRELNSSKASKADLDKRLLKSIFDDNFSVSDVLVSILKDLKVNGSGEFTGNLIVKDEAVTYSQDGIQLPYVTVSSEYLNDLLDVTISNPLVNQYLKYNGTDWINSNVSYTELTNVPSSFTPAKHTHAISDVISLQTTLNNKVDVVSGKGLSTEDYTTAEKTKLSGIEEGAQVNTVTSVAGKTGAVTLIKADVGLSNVDNTSDINKPISTLTQAALDEKLGVTETAVDSNKLGGRQASDYWHLENSNLDTVDWRAKDLNAAGNGNIKGSLLVLGEATTYTLDGVETNIKASTGAQYIWELADVDDLVKDAPDGSILIKNNGRWEAVESITINAGDYKII